MASSLSCNDISQGNISREVNISLYVCECARRLVFVPVCTSRSPWNELSPVSPSHCTQLYTARLFWLWDNEERLQLCHLCFIKRSHGPSASNLTHTHTHTVTGIMAVCYHQMTKTGITDLITTEVRELHLKVWSLNWMEGFGELRCVLRSCSFSTRSYRLDGEHRSRWADAAQERPEI